MNPRTRREQGLCVRCGQPRVKGYSLCQKHREQNNRANERWRARKQREERAQA